MERLGRAKDLRAHGEAAIPTYLDSQFGDHRELFRRPGGLALHAVEDGDDVWSWRPAETCLDGGAIGLALVRGDEIVAYREVSARIARHQRSTTRPTT